MGRFILGSSDGKRTPPALSTVLHIARAYLGMARWKRLSFGHSCQGLDKRVNTQIKLEEGSSDMES